jgi:hypothetical protein
MTIVFDSSGGTFSEKNVKFFPKSARAKSARRRQVGMNVKNRFAGLCVYKNNVRNTVRLIVSAKLRGGLILVNYRPCAAITPHDRPLIEH